MLVEYDVSSFTKNLHLRTVSENAFWCPKMLLTCGRKAETEKRSRIHVDGATANTFLCISLLSPHDYDVKLPNFTFYVGRQPATTKISFSDMFF